MWCLQSPTRARAPGPGWALGPQSGMHRVVGPEETPLMNQKDPSQRHYEPWSRASST